MIWFHRLFAARQSMPANRMRWVVVDCESSGLDPRSDRLLSIGAIAIDGARISVDAGFSKILRQDSPSDATNIAIHGITGGQQTSGTDGREAMRLFADYAGDAPFVAFHAAFDRALMSRAAAAAGLRLRNRWLDVAALAPVLYPEKAGRVKSLDQWLTCFDIKHSARHDALGDAYATAQLFQVLLSSAATQGMSDAGALFSAERQGRWVTG